MENKLTMLKSEFNGIIAIKTNVQNVFDVLQVRINKLKLFYAEFIKNSKTQMFVFGLDSFQFQSKLIDIEFDDMKRLFGAIMNRMYCEYYKLNKIIIDFILKSVDDKKYTDVLSKMSFKLDFPTYTGLLKATKLPSSSVDRVRVKDELDSIIFSRLPKEGPIEGEVYKQIESQLRQRAAQLGRGTVSDQDVGDALKQASVSLKEGLRKQNPKYNSELRRIDSAYGDISVMKTAAANTGAENGVFTPRQYKTAVRQSDTTRKKSQFAAGTARGQDVAEDAVSVMEPRQTANLEGRMALSNVGAYSMAANPATAIPVALAAPILYSESGVKMMNALMRSRPDVMRRVGEVLTKRSSKEGSISAAQVMEEYKRQTQAQE